MGFQQGLSGLNVSAKSLDTIGNNIANANTVGFKSSTTQFADVYASSLTGGGGAQVGIGAAVAGIAQQFSQGNITTTNNPLDLAINGGGMFRLSDDGNISYSRNGQFLVDKDGYIVNSTGDRMTGYGADAVTGAIIPGSYVELQVNSSNIQPNPTALSQMQVNLDSRAVPPSAMTPNIITGTVNVGALAYPRVVAAGANQLSITTNPGTGGSSTTTTVTIPVGTYNTVADLATAVQTGIDNAGVAATAGLDSTNTLLQFTSTAVGTGATIAVAAAGADTGFATYVGATTLTQVAAPNFSITDTNSYTGSTAQTVYDTLGNPHNLTVYFAKTSVPGRWQIYTTLNGAGLAGPTDMAFTTTGGINTAITPATLTQSFILTNGAASPFDFTLDFTGSTQYGIDFSVNQLLQDGYTSGKLSGLSVSSDGVLQGRYSNGKSRSMGQLVLVNFNNPNGLTSLGGNKWAESYESGQPIAGTPGQGSLGAIQSAAVEESNIDLTAELVNMITQQRVYQANAQTIKTQDSVLQTLVNLR